MAVYLRSSLLLASLAVILLRVASTEADINAICSRAGTKPPGFCLKFLRSKPGAESLDLYGIARLTIESARQHASGNLKLIQSLDKNATDPYLKSCYGVCADVYDAAIDNLENALEALAARDLESLLGRLSAALTDSGTCTEDSPGETFSPPPLLMNEIVDFENICQIGLVVSELLPK